MQASHNHDKGAAKKAAVDSVLSQDIVRNAHHVMSDLQTYESGFLSLSFVRLMRCS